MLFEALRGKVAGDPVAVEGAEMDAEVEVALVASGGTGVGAAEGSEHGTLTDRVAGLDLLAGVVDVERRLIALAFDAAFAGFVLAQQIERNVTHNAQYFSAVATAPIDAARFKTVRTRPLVRALACRTISSSTRSTAGSWARTR